MKAVLIPRFGPAAEVAEVAELPEPAPPGPGQVLFGKRSLRRALSNYVDHFHAERNHQGKGNVLLFPRVSDRQLEGPVQCRERLGGLLRYYHREAA
jgi:NADPH:quinone reductase-like Zn-dependent oxidoreductase